MVNVLLLLAIDRFISTQTHSMQSFALNSLLHFDRFDQNRPGIIACLAVPKTIEGANLGFGINDPSRFPFGDRNPAGTTITWISPTRLPIAIPVDIEAIIESGDNFPFRRRRHRCLCRHFKHKFGKTKQTKETHRFHFLCSR